MKALFPHAATTRGVTVRVAVTYLPDQSHPDAGRWFWSYHIRIENGGAAPVQLLSRHWLIDDANGVRHEVKGEGVIGDQPLIRPGASYDYVSGCPLGTRYGTMQGSYRMKEDAGDMFDAAIPRFQLVVPVEVS